MNKDEILNASRKENSNRDLVDIEVQNKASSYAARVGALVCCLLSLLASFIARQIIYSPWVIYFSIMGTNWLVRYIKIKRTTDIVVAILFLVLAILAFIGFVNYLLEVQI